MSDFLKHIKDSQQSVNATIENKLKNNIELTDEEIRSYEMTQDDQELMSYFGRVLNGESVPGFKIHDFLATPQAKTLIPQVLIGAARKAADPIYMASKFYKKVRLKNGNAIQFPSFGVMRAFDVAEGGEIPAQSIDWNLSSNSLINVGKVGVRIQYTDEVIKDTEFDIVGIMTAEAGRAMARHKEQKAFTEFRKHGYVVFDNLLYKKDNVRYADAATTGVDYNNNLNGTMSLEDYLDLCIAVFNNGYTPTNTIMHPLAFPAFVKNGLTGALTAVNERDAKFADVSKSFVIGPDAIAGKLPFGLQVDLSNQAPINREARLFDMVVVDKDNVGFLVVKEDIYTEKFREPARDLNNLKLVERYGYSTKDEGRAVCMAKNIAMSKSYPMPNRVKVIQG